MLTEEQENFFKIVLLLYEVSPIVLEQIIVIVTIANGGDLDKLLRISHDFLRKVFCNNERQLNKLFPSDKPRTNTATWDIQMFTNVILYLTIFNSTLSPTARKKVKCIKKVRNEIIAHSSSASMYTGIFEEQNKKLIDAITTLAEDFDESIQKTCKDLISKVLNDTFDSKQDSICKRLQGFMDRDEILEKLTRTQEVICCKIKDSEETVCCKVAEVGKQNETHLNNLYKRNHESLENGFKKMDNNIKRHCKDRTIEIKNSEEHICSVVKENNDQVIQVLTKLEAQLKERNSTSADGKYVKTIKYGVQSKLKLTAHCEKCLNTAENVIKETFDLCLNGEGKSGCNPETEKRIQQFIDYLRKFPDLELKGAEISCILLHFVCFTYQSLIEWIRLIDSIHYRMFLDELAVALEKDLKQGQFITFSSIIPIEKLQIILPDTSNEVQNESQSHVKLAFECKSDEALSTIMDMFVKGNADCYFDSISEAVSKDIRSRIHLSAESLDFNTSISGEDGLKDELSEDSEDDLIGFNEDSLMKSPELELSQQQTEGEHNEIDEGMRQVSVQRGFASSSEAKQVSEISQKLADFVIKTGTKASVTATKIDLFTLNITQSTSIEEDLTIRISLVEGKELGWNLITKWYSEHGENGQKIRQKWLVVERIHLHGLAHRSRIKVGDRLIQIQGIPIEQVDKDAVGDIIANAKKDVTVVVRRTDEFPFGRCNNRLVVMADEQLRLSKIRRLEEEHTFHISMVDGEDLGWHLTNESYIEELETNEQGVFVERIRVQGLANRSGIKAGDKLIQIQDIPVEHVGLKAVEDIIASAGKDLTVVILRPVPYVYTDRDMAIKKLLAKRKNTEKEHKIRVSNVKGEDMGWHLTTERYCEELEQNEKIKQVNPSQLMADEAAAMYTFSASEKVEFERLMAPKTKKVVHFKDKESDDEEEKELSIEVSAETFIRRIKRLSHIPNFPDDIDPNPFIRHGRSFSDLTDEEIFQFMRTPRRKHFAKKDVPNITSAQKGFKGYPLHEAVFENDVELCNTLLQFNAGLVKQTNLKQETALHVAAMVSSVDCMQVLSQAGADLNACNKWGQTPLHYAAEYKTLPVLEVLLGNPSVDVNKKDVNGFTPLLDFIDSCENYCQDWINVVQLFMNAGADINSQTVYGQGILHLVSEKTSNIDFLSHLIKSYKNINYELCTVMEETFLHILVMNASGREMSRQLDQIDVGNEGVVKRLLNTVDKFGEAPWYIMYKRGETALSLFESFVSKYGISAEKTDNHGNTGLHQLAITIICQFSLECMDKFMTTVEINSRNIFGQTPVSLIGDDEVLELFIKCKIDVNISDRWGRTPLMHIIGQKPPTDPVMIDILVKQGGADVNATDMDGSTALHYAAYCGTSEQVSRLISYGADVEAKDNEGDRPIDTARRHQNSQCYEFLAKACKPDAEPSSKNIIGNLFSRTTHEIAFSSLNDSDQSVRELLNISVDDERFTDDLLKERHVDMSKGDLKEEIDVINAVRQHVTEMCEIIAGYDELFTMKIYPTGSSVEGTKVGSPDEFDFVLLLENISQHFEACDGQEKGYASLKIKEQSKHIQKFISFIDEEGYFIAHPFLNYLHRYFKRCIMERRLWQDGRLYYRSEDELFHRHGKPVNTFSMYWMGSKYKKLKISVDLVPAVYKPGWWPTYIKLDQIRLASKKVRAAGCLVLLQMHTENFSVIKMRNSTRSTVNSYFIESNKRMLRISVAPAEIALITSLPENFRRAYALAKIMKGDDICPTLEMDRYPGYEIPEFKRLKVKPSSVLKSYLLKNCTFYIFADILGSIEINITPKKFAIKIFEYLLDRLDERRVDKMVLKPYFLPYANIFETTFDEIRLPSNIYTQMFNRQAIVRTILGILGAPSFEELRCESSFPLSCV